MRIKSRRSRPNTSARADIEVIRCRSRDVGHPHFNLRFKLANLAAINYPFLYLDADTYVLGDLRTSGSAGTPSRGSASTTSGFPPIRARTAHRS